MKSPEPNNISIRLEINIPTGVCAAVAGPTVPRKDKDLRFLFRDPLPPDDDEGPWAVLPVTAALGTICGKVDYDDYKDAVWAAAYPAEMYPPTADQYFPRPFFARLGTPSNSNQRWSWDATNAVKWAAHSSAGLVNRFAIWYRASSSSDEIHDGVSSFLGVSNAEACADLGSGSETIDPELDCADVIRVVIPDGPNSGEYKAKRTGKRTWEVSIKGQAATVVGTYCRKLSIRSGGKEVTASKSISGPPFLATFDGSPFGSKADVMVMIA